MAVKKNRAAGPGAASNAAPNAASSAAPSNKPSAKSGTQGASGESETISYTKAFEELQQIVDELENEEVEVDNLVSRLQRAEKLLQICKARLTATETAAEKLLDKIRG